MLRNYGGRSLQDILAGLTASFAFNEDDMGSQMQLNGLGNDYILVLVDGKRMAFDVTAVYTNGVESLPATAVITITTDIRQISADGQPVDIYTIDGRLVRSQAKSLEGLRGVYVVNGQKYMLK